jgi:hypothetical protein
LPGKAILLYFLSIGTVRDVSPIRDVVDDFGDVFSFLESRMDVLDDATEDIYAFLASLDSGVAVVTPAIEDPFELKDFGTEFDQSI